MPEDGATRVEIHATLVITFNAAVEPTSLTYTLDGGAEGVVPELDAAWNAPHYTEVTLTPRTALSAGTGYTVSGIGASPADTLHYAALSGGRFGFVTAAGRGAPTVSITSPEPGTTVDGVFQVAVTAQPGTGAASVQQVDVVFGDQAQTIEAASGAVTLNSCYLNNGTHAITAVATDTDGVRSEAAAIDVVVDNFAFYIDERVQVVTADAPGASVAVPVSITDATGGVGFSMTINYDPATLSVASAAAVRKGAAVPGNALLIVNAVESGNLYISCAGTEVFDSAQQEILVIDFDIVSRPVGGLTRIDLDDTEDARPSLDWVHTTRGTLRPKAVGGWIDIP
jgi:hypothetical protein